MGAESLFCDIKSGTGGIREIELFVQAHQLLHAGRYPFLQTHSTTVALEQLARYELVAPPVVKQLDSAYWTLRTIENRLQMREERQTHTLPAADAERNCLALSLGFPSLVAFDRSVSEVRAYVNGHYRSLFAGLPDTTAEFTAWWTFFTGKQVPGTIEDKIRTWFGNDSSAAEELRRFVCGEANRRVTKDQVAAFEHLAKSFDALMPEIARPVVLLKRLARFAERYSSRTHFFASCGSNPQFFRVLAPLFDRSEFIHELLCARPEILEEILRPEVLRQRKDRTVLQRELSGGPRDLPDFSSWLQVYIRAEQVRYTIAELLCFRSPEELERSLAQLADAVWAEVLRRVEGLDRVVVVALGNYGGSELTLGSDLDVMFVTDDEENTAAIEACIRRALTILRHGGAGGAGFVIDTRLRPHGDAGPLAVTLSSFFNYHTTAAQLWEKQLLTRARSIVGPANLIEHWEAQLAAFVYGGALSRESVPEIWRMRLRIQQERDTASPTGRAFKTGPGGLVDHEFFVQALQLIHGANHPLLRTPNTREGLAALAREGVISNDDAGRLIENYDFLKRLEIRVRGDKNQHVSVLPADAFAVARWLGFPSEERFWTEHRSRLEETRKTVTRLLFGMPEIT